MRILPFIICAAGLLSLAGCNIRPSWGPPGPVYFQRNQAVLYDPFPDNRAGPMIEGGRPLGYDRPMHETKNLQTSPFARQ